MLTNIFFMVLNMSITASVAAVLIIFFRWVFGSKLPRVFSYFLWSIVLVRLLIPFSLPSMFSIFNTIPLPQTIAIQSQQYDETYNNIQYSTDYESISQHGTDGAVLNDNENVYYIEPTSQVPLDPMKALTIAMSWIWLAGTAGLFLFSIFAYFRASRRLRDAVLYKNDYLASRCSQKLKSKKKVQIYTSDRIHTPVVCGLINPRVILPLDLSKGCSELELENIITHELVHIKRFDYIIKPLSMFALCVHWFNPLVWLCLILSQKDMEMSCDERVMSVSDKDVRQEYATSLIKLASKQNVLLNGGLLAFGESNIKSRIKGIMSFRKPALWLSLAAIAGIIIIGAVLLTNGQYSKADKEVITAKDNRRLESIISEYYLKTQPNNKGVLNIYNIEKYGSGYLALTEKHFGDGESGTLLLLVDSGFNITAVAPGNMPISPCFSANIVKHQGKSIIYGNLKSKKWDIETDTVVDVQIDRIRIIFDDGTVLEEPVFMEKGGYITVVDTTSNIKNIEVYNNMGELQSKMLSESYCTEYSFRKLDDKSGFTEDELELQTDTTGDSSPDTDTKQLWIKDGWTYYLEQIPRGGTIPMDNYVGRLCRYNYDGTKEILDELVKYSNKDITIFPAGERIVFIGFAGTDIMDFKTDTIISVKQDGSDRRTYNTKFNVARQLCYDNGYLYYEGWTNDIAFPRPVCRIDVDLNNDVKIADIDGSLITVYDGYAYYLNGSIYRLKLDWSSQPEIFDKAAIGKSIISVHKIADNEYNVVYDDNSKPYVLRLMDDKRKAFNVIQKYFLFFENADYKSMSALATENHNKNYVHDGDVWGMKWARAKEIELMENREGEPESILVYGVSVDMETVKTSAQHPSTKTSFFVILVKGEDGDWRVDRYRTG